MLVFKSKLNDPEYNRVILIIEKVDTGDYALLTSL